MLYHTLVRPLLCALDPETAHHLALRTLQATHRLGLLQPARYHNPHQLWGLHFPNRIGLAAGVDKDGRYLHALAALGFGYLEIGTVVPGPQPGHPRPRLARLPQQHALFNRMGCPSQGAVAVAAHLRTQRYRGILGINIGPNATTLPDELAADYRYCMRQLYPYASYFTLNLSSPNTASLRPLQTSTALPALLQALRQQQAYLTQQHQRYVPLVLKIAPDLTAAQLQQLACTLLTSGIDGVIATNSLPYTSSFTPQGPGLPGGLTGAPVREAALRTVTILVEQLGSAIPVIGCGGISQPQHGQALFRAGAQLLQLYTGLVYQGPRLIKQLAQL